MIFSRPSIFSVVNDKNITLLEVSAFLHRANIYLHLLYFVIGTPKGRVNDIVGNLNMQFSLLISTKSEDESYFEIIKTNPYAVLSKYTYDHNPTPLNINQEKKYDPESNLDDTGDEADDDDKYQNSGVLDVGNDEESDDELRQHLIKFPKHAQLLLQFRNAKIAADRCKKKTFVTWRGHRTSMTPGTPNLDYPMFKRRLLKALDDIKDISVAETEVQPFNLGKK